MNGIGNASQNGVTGTVDVTTGNEISLYADHYKSGGIQTWTSITNGVRYLGTTTGTWAGSAITLPGTDLYLDFPGAFTLTIGSDLSCQNLYFYRGTLDMNGMTITTADFVVFGSDCDFNDSDFSVATNTRFEYFPLSGLNYFPGGGTYAVTHPGFTDQSGLTVNAELINSSGSVCTIDLTGNFYNNGTDMLTGDFKLILPSNAISAPDFNASLLPTTAQWGTPYAVAFNMSVSNSEATGGMVAAASPTVIAPIETNQNVTDGLGNTGWQFSRPQINTAATTYDNVIHIHITDQAGIPMLIENSNDEIRTRISAGAASLAAGSAWYNAGFIKFTETWTDAACTISTDGAGDISDFYIQTINTHWNTDADGTGPGDTVAGLTVSSTDRSGTPQNIIPDISLVKGLLHAADGKTMIRNYGANSFPAFTGTTDECRPVLVAVRTGQELHVDPPAVQKPYDGHNFLELQWSEPVTITGYIDWTAPVQSSATFDGATAWGGEITNSGPGLSIPNYITIAGGSLVTGSRGPYSAPLGYANPDQESVHSLYRNFSINGTTAAADQDQLLRISIAGWSTDDSPWQWFWPGFIESAITPSGIVTVLANTDITDADGNELDTSTSITVYSTALNLYGPWDVNPPDLAGVKSAGIDWDVTPTIFEAIPIANSGTQQIEYLELHFFDNTPTYPIPGLTYKWQSKTGWFDPSEVSFTPDPLTAIDDAPEAFGGSRPGIAATSTSGGIRDSSLYNTTTAFTVTPNTGAATPVSTINTTVNSPFMSPAGTQSLIDDPYIRLEVPSTWPIGNTTLTVAYDQADSLGGNGFITDLAGNRLRDFLPRQTLDRTPPKITLTLAGAYMDQLFMLFSKPVSLPDASFYIEDSISITLDGSPNAPISGVFAANSQSILFKLPNKLTPAQILDPASIISLTIAGASTDPDTGLPVNISYFQDAASNYVNLADTHPITNLGIGIVTVLSGSDGVNADGLLGTNEGALRTFDGTGRLLDRDITIRTQLDIDTDLDSSSDFPPATTALAPLTLYFDVNPGAAAMPDLFAQATGLIRTLWLPSILASFNTQIPINVRSLSPIYILPGSSNLFRNFLLPEADAEIIPGSKVEMLFKYGDLYCARLTNPSDITSVAPWSFSISETKRQRGGVTILNNVIDSNKKEKAIIQVEVPKAGNIVIQVFTMDGNVVKVIDRGRRGGGTYSYFWDGTNGAGNPVARGIYFIRVVGPDMDEIRKVMVVKE